MPTVKDFGGFRLFIYFEDENPPHVHAVGSDFEAKIRIADAALYAGKLPPAVRRKALAYVVDNRQALMALWDAYKA